MPEETEVLADFAAVTPLYAFISDSEELNIGESFRLVKYDPDSMPRVFEEDILFKHLQLYKPDYLLWQHPPVERPDLLRMMKAALLQSLEHLDETDSVLYYLPTTNLFRCLRLFKPGRLVASDTFVLWRHPDFAEGAWETFTTKRSSEMIIDYGLLRHQSGSYTLAAAEMPFFNMFCKALLPVLESLHAPKNLNKLPPLEIALEFYGLDEFNVGVTIINCLTALEALLTNESNAELSYRLSLRVANLLNSDDTSRINMFKDMKAFYDLRSRIIHGSLTMLTPKLQTRLQQVESLRDIVRRAILSVMAVMSDENMAKMRLDELLDDLVFDQGKREEVQRLAAKFLHLEGAPPSKVN